MPEWPDRCRTATLGTQEPFTETHGSKECLKEFLAESLSKPLREPELLSKVLRDPLTALDAEFRKDFLENLEEPKDSKEP